LSITSVAIESKAQRRPTRSLPLPVARLMTAVAATLLVESNIVIDMLAQEISTPGFAARNYLRGPCA